MNPRALPLLLSLVLVACATRGIAPGPEEFGAAPVLPPPEQRLIPTVHIAPARPWQGDAAPTAAAGFEVNAFARGLDHPRWLLVLPDGDVLVAETDAPSKPEDSKGLRGWLMKKIMRRAGSGLPSADRITLLRDADGDGTAESRSVFLQGLHSPFGMALAGYSLYVADTDALLRFPYRSGDLRMDAPGTKVADLPAGPINHHWTKNVIATRDGRTLYVTIGSNSNAGENGIGVEKDRAAILAVDAATGAARVYASGLRNPVGLAWQPDSGALWVAVNERDELGDALVPDYMTAVREGAFYGWPYSWYGAHVDARVTPQRPDLVAKAIVPDYALGAHTASLGLAFYEGDAFAPRYRGGAFVGQHGSWNRRVRSGYKVIFVPFRDGIPSGPPEDVLSGFLDADGHARGRPVGVAVDRHGALLVADDVGGCVWRVRAASPAPVSPPSSGRSR